MAAAIRGVPGVGERFQIRVRFRAGRDEIAIALEGEGVPKGVILEALLKTVPALRPFESDGALIVEVVKRGAIPTIASKTPLIVDERVG